MSERDEFEAWLKSTIGAQADLLFMLRDYSNGFTNDLWLAWQAARAPQAVPALTDEQILSIYRDDSNFKQGKDCVISFARAILAAQQRAAMPEGWKLVPVEPTREMWAAFNKLDDEMAAGSYDGTGCSFEQGWNCMLAAAPQPSQEPEKTPQRYQD